MMVLSHKQLMSFPSPSHAASTVTPPVCLASVLSHGHSAKRDTQYYAHEQCHDTAIVTLQLQPEQQLSQTQILPETYPLITSPSNIAKEKIASSPSPFITRACSSVAVFQTGINPCRDQLHIFPSHFANDLTI